MLQEYCSSVVLELKQNYRYTIDVELIMELVMSLLESCINSEDELVESVREMGLLKRVALRLKAREYVGRHANKVADCLKVVADSYDDTQLCGVYQEVQTVFNKHVGEV